MWPFKKKEKFAGGGFVNHEKQPDHQEPKPNELDISEPIKTIAELIDKKDERVFIECKHHGYVFTIKSNDFLIIVSRTPSVICDSFFGSSDPEIGITKSEAKILYDACYKRAERESLASEAENRAKLVEIYCNSDGLN